MGPGPQVGSGYEKTRPEPDPLSFLFKCYFYNSCSDLFIAEKIMVFVSFRSVQIWIFLCSFSPIVWLLRKSVSGKHFLFFGPQNGPWNTMARGAHRAPQKKILLIIGPDPGRKSRPAGQVQVWKNLTCCHSYTKQLYTGYQELTLFSFFFFFYPVII